MSPMCFFRIYMYSFWFEDPKYVGHTGAYSHLYIIGCVYCHQWNLARAGVHCLSQISDKWVLRRNLVSILLPLHSCKSLTFSESTSMHPHTLQVKWKWFTQNVRHVSALMLCIFERSSPLNSFHTPVISGSHESGHGIASKLLEQRRYLDRCRECLRYTLSIESNTEAWDQWALSAPIDISPTHAHDFLTQPKLRWLHWAFITLWFAFSGLPG